MERVIKFRTWDGEKYVSPDYISRNGFAWWKENSIPTSSDTVEQFTGLLDKNGEEIYEGDVVDYLGIRFKIIFHCGAFGYKYFGDFHWLVNFDKTQLKIIGNIFENPELLEATK
jgi:hypothetical protein